VDADELLVARVTTTIVAGGRRYPIRKGVTVVHRDDPVVQGRQQLFRPLTVTRLGGRPVRSETATAGPGEFRGPVLPPEPEPEAPAGPLETWTRKELADECRARGLPTSGTKDELIGRLMAGGPGAG